MKWRELHNETNTTHPQWSECVHYINNLPESDQKRRNRAKQLFLYLIINDAMSYEPEFIEVQLHQLFEHVSQLASFHLTEEKDNHHG